MQIVGQEIDPNLDVDSIIEQLKPHRYFDDSVQYFPVLHKSDAYRQIISDTEHKTPAEKDKEYQSFVKKPLETVSNIPEHVEDLLDIGHQYYDLVIEDNVRMPHYFLQAVNAYRHAMLLADENAQSAQAYQASGCLYTLIQMVSPLVKHALSLQEIRMLESCRENAFTVHLKNERGVSCKTTNSQAWGVEQREIGFSSSAPIGTENLQQCVGLMVRDPVTKKTAVTHLDSSTNPKTLATLFKRIPSTNGTPLEVRIVGAVKSGSNKMIDTGLNNLKLVLGALRNKPVNILSADILEYNQPSAFVVFPETGEMQFCLPDHPNPNYFISRGRTIVSSNVDLHTAFDLTTSTHRTPVLVDRSSMRLLGYSAQGMESMVMDGNGLDPRIPTLGNYFTHIKEAYEKTRAPLLDAFSHAAKEHQFPEEKVRVVLEQLRKAPLFIGENADICNRSLYELVQKTGWITDKKNPKSKALVFDERALGNYNPSPAINYIEKEYASGFQAATRDSPSQARRGPG
jgi:chemotaxis receptor (MCP) glutamine deamidase CheD